MRGVYTQTPLYVGDYLLGMQDGKWGLVRQTSATSLLPFGVYAQPASSEGFIPFDLSATGIQEITVSPNLQDAPAYNIMGQRVDSDYKGIVIVEGKKMIRK